MAADKAVWGQALVPLLSPLFQQRRYRKGEIMAEQGTPASTLFYIQSGECEVLHRLDAGGDEDFEDEVSLRPDHISLLLGSLSGHRGLDDPHA